MAGEHGDNVANAMSWFKFTVMATQWVVTCPWLVYLVAAGDSFYRTRAFRDQLEVIDRSDVLVLSGPKVSPHMRFELDYVRRRNPPIPVLDLMPLGSAPPWSTFDEAAHLVRAQIAALGL